MRRAGVPKRILKLRRIGERENWWDVAPYLFADGRRTLRKWLADPDVPEELKAGDAELLATFEAHQAERRCPTFHLLTREEMASYTPEQIEHMVTVELHRTHADAEQVEAMREAAGQTRH